LARQFYIDREIEEAAFILEQIDKRWPEEGVNEQEP
jgi:hypothetical protein